MCVERPIIVKMHSWGSSYCNAGETNPARNQEVLGSIPGLSQWVKGSGGAVSCGVGHRCGSDLALLWLWYRPAAVVPVRPLAWEPPYVMGVAPKSKKIATTTKKHI